MVAWVSIAAPIYIAALVLTISTLVYKKIWLRVTNRAPGVAANAASTSFWSFDLLDPLHPATPALGPRWALLVVRLAGLAYFAALFPVQEWAYPGDDLLDANWVQWFTNWSFVVFGLSMLLGAVVTGLTMWPQRGGPAASKPLPRWSALRAAHVLALQVAAGVGLFLSVFYWAALYDPAKGLATPAASVLNLFMAADVLVGRTPFVTHHALALLLYAAAYSVFMWIYQAVAGTWVYEILDWNKGWSIVVYLALPFGVALSFAIYFGLAALREHLLRRRAAAQEAAAVVQPGVAGGGGSGGGAAEQA